VIAMSQSATTIVAAALIGALIAASVGLAASPEAHPVCA
jgi:hypothetical protein